MFLHFKVENEYGQLVDNKWDVIHFETFNHVVVAKALVMGPENKFNVFEIVVNPW